MALGRQGRDLSEKMADGVVVGKTSDMGVQGGATAALFQKDYSARDKRDDMVMLKQQLMNQDGMTPFGQVYASDEDMRWLERKAAAAEQVNFDDWFASNFNVNDLAGRQWAQEVYPKFYSDRENEMLQRTQEAFKIKMLQLRGPQTKEDLVKLYLLNTGRVVLPPDWDVIGADPSKGAGLSAATSTNAFNAGLIRLPLFFTPSQRTDAVRGTPLRWGQGEFGGGDRPLPFGQPAAARNALKFGSSLATNQPFSKGDFAQARDWLDALK